MTGPELKSIRKRLHMTQPELAKALGLSLTNGDRTIRRWEKGHWPVPKDIAKQIEQLGRR